MSYDFYVTGSRGFIGSNLVRYLAGQNVQPFHFGKKDRPFVVIHLAAYGNHYHQQHPEEIVKANVLDLMYMVNDCRQDNLVKFYNVSTSSVTLPKQTMYSASKMLGETIVENLKDDRFVSVRPYSVYGPGEAARRFIPTVIRHLHSGQEMPLDTKATHDWIYVEDFIKAMLAGHTIVGTGMKYSNLEVVEMLQIISGKKLNYRETNLRPYDNYAWVSPVTVPHRSLFQGLKETYESFTR
jgi:nucleoside-diphosphate-sugar epimerase